MLVVVLILALFGGLYLYQRSGKDTSETGDTALSTPSPSPSVSPTPSGSPGVTSSPKSVSTKTSTEVATTLDYGQAITQYASTRIQLNAQCQATPSRFIGKNGIKVMFDNRNSAAVTIAIDGKKFNLAGYGFKIISVATSASLPHSVHIDCGSGKNVAQIDIQG